MEFYGDINFVYTYSGEIPPVIDTSSPAATGITVNGVSITVADVMNYTLPCGSDTVIIEILHAESMYCARGDIIVDRVEKGSYSSMYVITIVNPTASGDTSKVYTLHIKKRFELFDIVVERYGNSLTVNNNPSSNGGYSFSNYTWYVSETKEGLGSVISNKQYYSAGPNESNLLNEELYYYVVLQEATLGMEQTCAEKVVLHGEPQSLSVYPNPAPGRSKMGVMGLEGYSANASVFILDLHGRAIFTGRVSDVWGGIYTPESTGMYLLRVISEEGISQTVKFVVK
jgi:hypothetical protein